MTSELASTLLKENTTRFCRPDQVTSFGERQCMRGGLGPRLPATEIMELVLANALRLEKFGA
jgi:2,3-bisphosphoglycerate-independent phosphoglycerate mutase